MANEIFETKKEKWEWVKANTPDIAELILDINRVFGRPAHVRVIPLNMSAIDEIKAFRMRRRAAAAGKAMKEIREVVG